MSGKMAGEKKTLFICILIEQESHFENCCSFILNQAMFEYTHFSIFKHHCFLLSHYTHLISSIEYKHRQEKARALGAITESRNSARGACSLPVPRKIPNPAKQILTFPKRTDSATLAQDDNVLLPLFKGTFCLQTSFLLGSKPNELSQLKQFIVPTDLVNCTEHLKTVEGSSLPNMYNW